MLFKYDSIFHKSYALQPVSRCHQQFIQPVVDGRKGLSRKGCKGKIAFPYS